MSKVAMADNIGVKRLKSSQDGVVAVAEVAELGRRNVELESEIEQYRRRGRLSEGNHEVLPVIVTATVDLSRLDMSLVTQIFSFLSTARGLLGLELTCKSFGRRQPTSASKWSLVEEVARQAVCSRATSAEMSSLPRYVSGSTTWLSILHRYEHLLLFDVLLGGCVEHLNGDKTTVRGTAHLKHGVAVTSSYIMSSGVHYADFKIAELAGSPCIGIVRPIPGLDAEAYERDEGDEDEDFCFVGVPHLEPDFLAQRSDEWGDGNVHACEYSCEEGDLSWTNWDDVNLDQGTLTIYKNNRRLGVMMDGLSGPYCWYVDIYKGCTIAIKRRTCRELK